MSLASQITLLAAAVRDKLNAITPRISTLESTVAGKANTSHVHNASDINAGALSAARLPAASTTAQGAAQLATDAVTRAGTVTNQIVTPIGLKNWEAWIRPTRKRVVFVGSSNTVPGTWPEKFMSLMDWTSGNGWTGTNKAIGGSGFTDSNWYNQIDAAYTELGATEALNVSYVFFGDSSNDVRSVINLSTYRGLVAAALSRARSRFPNARVIVLPLIWPANQTDYCPDAFTAFAHQWPKSVAGCMERLKYEAGANRCEFVDNSWTWMTGRPEFMSALKDVHPNATGYTEVARWMAAYMRGENTTARSQMLDSTIITPAYYEFPTSASFPALTAYVDGWDVTVSGFVTSKGATGAASDFARLNNAARPTAVQQIYCSIWGDDNFILPATVWPNGTVRVTKSVSAAKTFHFAGTYRVN